MAQVVEVDIQELTKAEYNPRRITDQQFKSLKSSIQHDTEFFKRRPCLVNKRDGRLVIYGGNMRYEAAKALGWSRVPCVIDEIPFDVEKQRNLKDNNAWGEYVDEQLAELVYGLSEEGSPVEELGFEDRKLDALLTEGMSNVDGFGAEPDEMPPIPIEAVSKLGEVYQLGPHRLMCGNSRDAKDIAKLMDGATAQLFATDPPYLVDYDSLTRPSGGKDWSALYKELPQSEGVEFFGDIFERGLAVCDPGVALYTWMAHRWYSVMIAVWKGLDIIPHQTIVWVKPARVMGFSYYSWMHEMCLFGWRKGGKPPFTDKIHKTSTVWTIPYQKPGDPTTPEYYSDVWFLDWEGKKRHQGLHPTMKPVGVWEIPMKIHTKIGNICLEPFAGGGGQFIAAEKLGRVCFGMELQPVFVDVVRDRYARFVKNPSLGAHPDEVESYLHAKSK